MAHLTPQQRAYIRKRTKVVELDPSETSDELNIVPFLDIVVNLIMFLLMSLSAVAFFNQIEVSMPKTGGGAGSAEQSLNLTLAITPRGIIISAAGGQVGPGCVPGSSGQIAVQKKGDDYDWEELQKCAKKLKEKFPDEEKVIVGGEPTVAFKYIVRAMDAVREADSQKLFPEVQLALGFQ